MDKKKALLAAAGALLAVGIVWTVVTVPDEPVQEENPAPARMEYQGSFLSEEQNGRVIWDLKSDTSAVDAKTQNTVMTNLVGHYYREDGTTLTLTAPHGVYSSETQNVKLTGGAKAVTSDGGEMTSDSLEWMASKDTLVAEGKAVLVQKKDRFEARADRIEAREGFQVFKAVGHAKIKKER